MTNYEIMSKNNNIAYIFDSNDIDILEGKIKVYRYNIGAKIGSYHIVKLNRVEQKNRAYFNISEKYNFRIRKEYISFITNEYKRGA